MSADTMLNICVTLYVLVMLTALLAGAWLDKQTLYELGEGMLSLVLIGVVILIFGLATTKQLCS